MEKTTHFESYNVSVSVCECVCALVCARGSILQANNHCLAPDGGVRPTQQKSSCFLRAREVGGSSVVRDSVCVCAFVCCSAYGGRY